MYKYDHIFIYMWSVLRIFTSQKSLLGMRRFSGKIIGIIKMQKQPAKC